MRAALLGGSQGLAGPSGLQAPGAGGPKDQKSQKPEMTKVSSQKVRGELRTVIDGAVNHAVKKYFPRTDHRMPQSVRTRLTEQALDRRGPHISPRVASPHVACCKCCKHEPALTKSLDSYAAFHSGSRRPPRSFGAPSQSSCAMSRLASKPDLQGATCGNSVCSYISLHCSL